MLKHALTDIANIHEHILREYQNHDVMLNSEHFDVFVKGVPIHKLLMNYAVLQYVCNGDKIVLLHDEMLTENENNEVRVAGFYFDLINNLPEHQKFKDNYMQFVKDNSDVFTGNYKDLLLAYNNCEFETHMYRLEADTIMCENGRLVGTKLDFIG